MTALHRNNHKLSLYAGVFVLINAVALLQFIQTRLSKSEFRFIFYVAGAGAAGVVLLGVIALTYMGVIAPWSGRLAIIYSSY